MGKCVLCVLVPVPTSGRRHARVTSANSTEWHEPINARLRMCCQTQAGTCVDGLGPPQLDWVVFDGPQLKHAQSCCVAAAAGSLAGQRNLRVQVWGGGVEALAYYGLVVDVEQ